jgi:hypothetical protein
MIYIQSQCVNWVKISFRNGTPQGEKKTDQRATVPPIEKLYIYSAWNVAHSFGYLSPFSYTTFLKYDIIKVPRYLPTTFDPLQTLNKISNDPDQLYKVWHIKILPTTVKSGDQVVKGWE